MRNSCSEPIPDLVLFEQSRKPVARPSRVSLVFTGRLTESTAAARGGGPVLQAGVGSGRQDQALFGPQLLTLAAASLLKRADESDQWGRVSQPYEVVRVALVGPGVLLEQDHRGLAFGPRGN